ncbi:hypothetical protein [Dyella mobilis]|uniref:Phage integrase family protein n=1 Tax=Dyella mobilis TaxID=1849582 RepID=A0ABS2K9Z9_9GAMM|nr:hypothetical protein [Dyella mobilis]MBM7127991.1 hypothetical protein [Dyella mobilis]
MDVLSLIGLTPQKLCHASDEQLLQIQAQLLMGNTWGHWEYPKEWGRGKWQTLGRRSYRLELVLPDNEDPDSPFAQRMWRELLRLTLALRLWPGPFGLVSKPSSIRSLVGTIGRVLRGLADSSEESLWARVDPTNARIFGGKAAITRLNVVAYFRGMGALPDGPNAAMRKGHQPRRDRTGEPEHATPKNEGKQWQPFPDPYTAAAGWRAISMMQAVGPNVIGAMERAVSIPIRLTTAEGKPLSKSSIRAVNKASRDDVIKNWEWRAPDNSELNTLPMAITLSASGRNAGNVPWPPRSYSDTWNLINLLQTSHLWLVALSLAGRHGEILEMKEDCLKRQDSETPTGRFVTWKLDGVSGRDAEAPLPDVVVQTLQQQVRLAKLVKRAHGVENDALWVKIGLKSSTGAGERLNDLGTGLVAFNAAFGIEPLMENTNVHMHRFRKTLVRIVALALVHAPKILMDILGHRDEQMTVMRYILSDPGMLSEIEEVTRELIILKGLEAIDKRDQLQGKAAPVLRERVEQYAQLLGRNALEPQNLREFVESITEGGSGWAIIGPGKVCTGFRTGGLCNAASGEANPHYCTPECHNQLLFPDYEQVNGTVASAVREAIETVDYMVEQLKCSAENGEVMLIAQFAGQITGLLRQWREVDQHFRDHHLNNPLITKHLSNVVLLP